MGSVRGLGKLVRPAAWVSTRAAGALPCPPLQHPPLIAPPLRACPSAELPPNPCVAWCFAAVPERPLGTSTSPSNSRSSLGSAYYLRISNAPKPCGLFPPSEVFRFPLILFFCFQITAPRMPACLADAEPETGHHLLAGKPYPPTPPCFPFPLPESPRPRETIEVETGGGNQNGSALLCKLQPETPLSIAASPWLRGNGVRADGRGRGAGFCMSNPGA